MPPQVVTIGDPPIPPPPPTAYPRSGETRGRFINLSVRGFVGTGDSVLVAGIVVKDGDRVLLARAIGPTLAAFGISGVLSRPKIEIFDGERKLVASNQGWGSLPETEKSKILLASQFTGAFPLPNSSLDAVVLLDVPAGAYTMVVSGLDGGVGNVLVEAYEVPTVDRSR